MLNRRILRIKAFKTLYGSVLSGNMSLAQAEASLEASCEAARDLYVYMLGVISPLTNVAREKIEAAKAKFNPTEEERNPNMKFVENALAELLDKIPCKSIPLLNCPLGTSASIFPAGKVSYKQNVSNRLSEGVYQSSEAASIEKAYEITHRNVVELIRTKYCIRHELGLCPIHQGAKDSGPLFLLNNGQRFALHFDCRNCEMTVTLA
jgi:hypothetical protein